MAETVGWLADKISIMELKIYHMREQIARPDVTAEFRAQCAEKVAVLEMQRDDLAAELTELLRAIADGRFGHMVALQSPHIVCIPIAEALASPKRVDPNHDIVMTARAVGISFGD